MSIYGNNHYDMWWSEGRNALLQMADSTSSQLLAVMEPSDVKVKLDAQLFQGFINKVRTEYDEISGGFGRPVKFPSVPKIRFLLRMWRRIPEPTLKEVLHTMVAGSLKGMACGGLYDHVGGGFFRCSTDVRWQIPQFEKTIHDNALLAVAYGEASQALGLGDPVYKEVMIETLKFMTQRMQAPDGGFYSALHSVTEGVEGSFYTWHFDEMCRALSEDELEVMSEAFGVTEWGNFEGGVNHLRLEDAGQGWAARRDPTVDAALQKLRVLREKRTQPQADDKLVCGWNGLAIKALSLGHRVCQGDDQLAKTFLTAAQKAAEKLKSMFTEGKLCRMVRGGAVSRNEGMLEDYAFGVEGN